jgi:hypothetical protein
MKTTLIIVSALTTVLFSTPLLARGEETDRGTLKKPDFVATPHEKDESNAEEHIFANVPNRSLAGDVNGDGNISSDEWEGSASDFIRLDTNHDGQLSRRELDAYIQLGIDKFANLDVYHDGVLTLKEWKDPPHIFRKLDMNKDDRLTRFEYYESPVLGNVEPENQ